jgi:hypothetical protein
LSCCGPIAGSVAAMLVQMAGIGGALAAEEHP